MNTFTTGPFYSKRDSGEDEVADYDTRISLTGRQPPGQRRAVSPEKRSNARAKAKAARKARATSRRT